MDVGQLTVDNRQPHVHVGFKRQNTQDSSSSLLKSFELLTLIIHFYEKVRLNLLIIYLHKQNLSVMILNRGIDQSTFSKSARVDLENIFSSFLLNSAL